MDVVQIIAGTARGDGDPGEIGLVSDVERGERHGELLPGICRERRQRGGRLITGVKAGIHLQYLSAAGTTVRPEGEIAVGGGVEVGLVKGNAAGGSDADGIGAGMNWRGVGKVARGPAPVLKVVDEMVGIDRQGSLRVNFHNRQRIDKR